MVGGDGGGAGWWLWVMNVGNDGVVVSGGHWVLVVGSGWWVVVVVVGDGGEC